MKLVRPGLGLVLVAALCGCSTEPEEQVKAPAAPASAAPATSAPEAKPAQDTAARLKAYGESLARGAQWLLTQQKEDGTFGGPAEVGKAALVVTAILSSPDAAALRDHAGVKKAIAYIVSMKQPDGSINTPGEAGLANYQTSAALTALCLYNDPAHKALRDKARDFLLSIQNRKGYDGGSWGYNRDKRGDLSNTQFTLEALKAAGLDENSEAFKNCLTFLQRCQNRSESSDFADAGNDGGAMYYPGRSNAGIVKLPNGKTIYKSYGSMTYALLRGYVLVGLKPDDPRVQAAQKWVTDNYTLEQNPGMPDDQKLQGLYYYYLSMAKALSLFGSPTVAAADGTKLPWASDLGAKLVGFQGPEGSWVNNAMRWMENDKLLATSYAMLALGECRTMLAKAH